ncbi:MAG: DUF6110 family protein [Peptococcaceae bacterium]|nr:DUF6110 family protein [Peptococcaceae bacterium]
MSTISKIACFVGGTLFGSVGIKLLSSKDAKKAYVHVTAAGLRAKDCVMTTVDTVQENANDILAAAQDLNDDRVAQEEAERAANIIADAADNDDEADAEDGKDA